MQLINKNIKVRENNTQLLKSATPHAVITTDADQFSNLVNNGELNNEELQVPQKQEDKEQNSYYVFVPKLI